jgi:hypothetical protein
MNDKDQERRDMSNEDTQGAAEPSPASAGSPGFAVWCCVHFSRHTTERLADDYTGELWIKLQMPAILPVGSWVDLPTPRDWRPGSGTSSGKISSWSLMGEVIVCEIDDPSHLGNDQGAELLAIGYADHQCGYPNEVSKASDGLFW